MALFSRRGKSDEPTPAPVADDAASDVELVLPEGITEEPVPTVGISVSTFGATSAPQRVTRRPAQTAPAAEQTIPGMADNVVLQAALTALPEKTQNLDVMNIMRQALQGPLYVRAQGDVQSLLAEGKGFAVAVTEFQGKRFMLAFSGGRGLQQSTAAEGMDSTSAVGQPALAILRNVVAGGYDGLYLDHATLGARMILPVQLIEKTLEEADPEFTIKSLLVAERGDATPLQVADALTRVKVWVAGGADESGRIGLAEARSMDGNRRLEVFSHPLEVLALGRGDRPLPLTPEQLGKTLASEAGLTGIVVDPAGPWIELDRDVLAPVIALAG